MTTQERTMDSSAKAFITSHSLDYAPYEAIYQQIHSQPELSHAEKATAALVVKTLESTAQDLDIRPGIGGHGVLAILHNGSGPAVMLRADMDALPVTEQTDLPYSSTITGVMHACGHDMHTTALLAASAMLIRGRSDWSGTLILLFQPAEEAGDGAKKMIADGLFDTSKIACPIPDIILGQHVAPLPAGTLNVKPHTVMAASDNFTITVHGHGGHGSMPHLCIDALVIAAHIVTRLQTIVSREMPPHEAVVITVGELHAGTAENIISNKAVMKLNMRTVSTEWRLRAIASVQRIVKTECEAGGCTQPPTIEHTSSLPITSNDATTAAKLSLAFEHHFAHRYLKDIPSTSASEDFNEFANAVGRPSCFWFWGGIAGADPMEDPTRPNINHSPFFKPLLQPTLATGTEALVVAALAYLSSYGGLAEPNQTKPNHDLMERERSLPENSSQMG